jgi:chromosome segregation ATPase
MRLTRLCVENVRQFRKRVEIDSLEPGINLFTGPNESGKSTLVEAIRAAFFERYRSSTASYLQPWGDTGVAPEISLRFEWQGQTWQLGKRFVKQARCDLAVGNERYSEDEAENRLTELLGYELPGRGASKPEHQGIPGLLWITQGTGQDVAEAIGYAGDHLHSALSGTLGELTSSADELIGDVDKQRDELLTKAGKPRGELKKALESEETLAGEVGELERKVQDYRETVDRLAELRHDHQQATREKPWETLESETEVAKRALTEVERLEERQRAAQERLEQCQASQQTLEQLLAAHSQRQEELASREDALKHAEVSLNNEQGKTQEIQTLLAQAKEQYDAARAQHRAAQAAALLRRRREALDAATREQESLAARLKKSQEVHQSLSDDLAALRRCEVDATQLRKAESLQKDIDTIAIQRDAIATRLSFDLKDDNAITLNDEHLAGKGERRLSETGRIEIEGVGQLLVHPGGRDIGELLRTQQQKEESLQTLLQEMKCSTLSDAKQKAEQASELTQKIDRARERLRDLAPDGPEALSAEHDSLKRKVEELSAELSKLSAPPSDVTDNTPSETEAAERLDNASATLRAAEIDEQKHQANLNAASQTAASAKEELQRLQDKLDDPNYAEEVQQAKKKQESEKATEETLADEITARQEKIDAANPDVLRQDIERLSKSAKQQREQFHARERELAALQSRIESVGADGIEETLADKQSQLERAQRHHAALERRAKALDLLLNTLSKHRQALTQKLQAPLRKQLQHYLRLLFPGAQLTVDENLQPQLLQRQRNGEAEMATFNDLSFGSREQMGLISRLAYADLLKEAGRPTLIILDDTLVHSDSRRLAAMKRMLFDAAQRHQILLFSCHPESWVDIGVVARNMRDLKPTDRPQG